MEENTTRTSNASASSIEEQINYHLEKLREDNLDGHRCIHYLLPI